MKNLILLLVFGWFWGLVLAQGSEDKKDGDPPEKNVEKKEVTGSRIRGLDLEGTRPVKVVTKEDFEKSVYGTVGAVLETETTHSILRDEGTRGLGKDREIWLLNGKRLPVFSGFTRRLDSENIFPISSVAKVEIITDGGGAIYGSDAINSVKNIITSKTEDGYEASIKYANSGPTMFHQLRTNLSYGKHFKGGYFYNDFSYNGFPTQIHKGGALEKHPNITPYGLHSPMRQDFVLSRGRQFAFPYCKKRDSSNGCLDSYVGKDMVEYYNELFNYTEFDYDLPGDITFSSNVIFKFEEIGVESSPTMRLPYPTRPGESGELPRIVDNHRDHFDYERGAGINEVSTFLITHRIKNKGPSQELLRSYRVALLTGLEGDIGLSEWRWSFGNTTGFVQENGHFGRSVLIDKAKEALAEERYNPFEPKNANDTTGFFYDASYKDNSLMNITSFFVDGVIVDSETFSLSGANGVEFLLWPVQRKARRSKRKGQCFWHSSIFQQFSK